MGKAFGLIISPTTPATFVLSNAKKSAGSMTRFGARLEVINAPLREKRGSKKMRTYPPEVLCCMYMCVCVINSNG